MTAGVRARVIGCAFGAREASASRAAKWPKENVGFNKNVKKSGPLIMGDWGLKTGPNHRFHFSSIVFTSPPPHKSVDYRAIRSQTTTEGIIEIFAQ